MDQCLQSPGASDRRGVPPVRIKRDGRSFNFGTTSVHLAFQMARSSIFPRPNGQSVEFGAAFFGNEKERGKYIE